MEYKNSAYSQAFAIVDKILTTNRVRLASYLTPAVESEIFAYARQTEYWARPQEVVEIDLSPSISIEHEIVDYQWSMDDGVSWQSGDKILRLSFNRGDYRVLARVYDGFAYSEPLEIVVRVGEEDLVAIPAPDTVRLDRQEENIVVSWKNAPENARYALVKVNGVALSYVEVTSGELVLTDLEYDQLESIELAWLDDEYNIGEFVQFDMSSFDETKLLGDWNGSPPDVTEETGSVSDTSDGIVEEEEDMIVKTGVSYGITWMAMIVVGLLLFIKILGCRYKKSL